MNGDGRTGGERSSGIVKGGAYALVIAAAIGGTWYATRDAAPATAAAPAHDHAAMQGGGGGSRSPVTLSRDDAARIGVTYAAVTVGPLSKEIRTVGQVAFDEGRVQVISPRVDGWVERLYVNTTGQPVVKGEPLLAIYSPMLVQAQEELLLAKKLEGEMGEGRAGTPSLVESARRRLLYWEIPEREIEAIERGGEVRRTLTLYAPATGYVLEKYLVPGQKVMAGEALYRIADLRAVWVEGEVFEQDLAEVRVGEMVHADFPALPGEHRMGRIAFVYPTVSPETRTARVRVVMPNGDLRLKPGMYATLRIVGASRQRVLTVPRDAVLSTGERNVLFVRDSSGALVPREVAVGSSSDERIEILRGVVEGETVVASATFLVDAESNLGKALGGMGDMPGMDMRSPIERLPMRESRSGGAAPAPAPKAKAPDPHAGHKMP